MISIAVSAVVQPSRLLRALRLLFYLVFCAVLAWLVVRRLVVAAGVGLVCAAMLAHYLRQDQQALQIDISGLGQIRLTVYKYLKHGTIDFHSRSKERSPTVMNAIVMHDHVVYLQPGCTLWPFLLLLCLETEYGHNIKLVIMRDSVDDAAFRALSVAIKTIAASGMQQNNAKKMR